MKSAPIWLLALGAQAIAAPNAPALQQNQAGSRDIEGGLHSWTSNWLKPMTPPKSDAFTKPQDDTYNDHPVTYSSVTSSTALSKRAAASSTTQTTTVKSSSSGSHTTTTTMTVLTPTTTTRSSTSNAAATTTKSTTGSSHGSTVDAVIQSSSTTTTRSSSTSSSSSRPATSSSTTSSLRTTTTTTTTTARPTTTTTTTTTRKTTTTTTTTPPAATRTIDVTGMTYQNALLIAHNVHRSNHSLPDLVWDSDLASTAQEIASNCVYGHNVTADGGGYGQNIGAGAPGNAAAGLVTNLMYNGEINYYPLPYGNDNPDLSNFHLWGHYSQLVWTDTTNVGCYTQYCPNGLANTGPGVAPYFTVCNYGPPGNYVGEFSEVPAPNGGQSVVITGQ